MEDIRKCEEVEASKWNYREYIGGKTPGYPSEFPELYVRYNGKKG